MRSLYSLPAAAWVLFSVCCLACPPTIPQVDVQVTTDDAPCAGETVYFDADESICVDPGTLEFTWVFPSQAYHIAIYGTSGQYAQCKFSPSGTYEVNVVVKNLLTGLSGQWQIEVNRSATCDDNTVVVSLCASTWYVSPDGNDDNNGQSWATAFETIQTAIDSASDGDEVVVKSGTEESPATYYEQLDLKGKSLYIHSEYPDDWTKVQNTIIDAQKQGTAVIFRGNEAVPSAGQNLKGFTIRNGAPAGDSLALHLQFDELSGTAASDISGKGRTGTLYFAEQTPVTTWTSGHLGGALEFDGDDYVQISGCKGIVGRGSRTCSAWIKTSDATWWKDIIGWGNYAAGQRWLVTINPDGFIQVAVVEGYQRGTTSVNDGYWHHVAVVLEDDGSPNTREVKIYIDGVEESSYTTLARAINTGSDPDVQIGLYNYNDTAGRYFKGTMDDVCIYSRALSAEEIKGQAGYPVNDQMPSLLAHWKLNQNFEDEINRHHGTSVANAVFGNGMAGDAVLLNGIDQWVEIVGYKGICGGNARTCAAWIKADSDKNQNQTILSWGENSAGKYWRFWLQHNVGVFGSICIGLNGGYYAAGSMDLRDGKWHHVMAVMHEGANVSDIKLYVDGREEPHSAHTSYFVQTGGIEDVHIGSDTDGTKCFSGCIDDVRIYNYALSYSEVLKVLQTRFSDGGGIRGHGASANTSQCVIKNNASEANGGGVSNLNGHIRNCIISGNRSEADGGGVYVSGAESGCELVNCLITGNFTEGYNGGGLYHRDAGVLDVVNCTITDNVGGAIVLNGEASVADIYNSILWHNRMDPNNSNDVSELILADGAQAHVSYSNVEGGQGGVIKGSGDILNWGNGNIDDDPHFVSWGSWGWRNEGGQPINEGTIFETDPNDPRYGDVIIYDFAEGKASFGKANPANAYDPNEDFISRTLSYLDPESGYYLPVWERVHGGVSCGKSTMSNDDDFALWFSSDPLEGGKSGQLNGHKLKWRCTNPLNANFRLSRRDSDYENASFFPLDDYYGLDGRTDQGCGFLYPIGARNWFFTVQYHGKITYVPGQKLYFKASDDLFVYIDRKLVVNRGGYYNEGSRVGSGPSRTTVILDQGKAFTYNIAWDRVDANDVTGLTYVSGDFCGGIHPTVATVPFLTPFQTYDFDLFYANRQACNSVLIAEHTPGGIVLTPYFSDEGDYHLLSGSPCIDAGINDPNLPAFDLDGKTRRADDLNTVDHGSGAAPIVDMGAYEWQPENQPPQAEAGSDRIISINEAASLYGASASDDGRPTGELNVLWSKEAGPGSVCFVPSESADGSTGTVIDPNVYFSTPGTYTLNLAVSDGITTVNDTMTVTVIKVDAGDNESICLPEDTVDLQGQVLGIEAGFSTQWSVRWPSGISTVTFGPEALESSAVFSAAGTYVLDLTITCQGSQFSDSIVVTVQDPSGINKAPGVRAWAEPAIINWPQNSVALKGQVWDDGLPSHELTAVWSEESVPLDGRVTFGTYTSENPNATAQFSRPGTYVLKLAADDGDKHDCRLVTVTVQVPGLTIDNRPPTAYAGAGGTVVQNQYPCQYTLSDAQAQDPDGNPLTIQWSLIDAAEGLYFLDPGAETPTVVVPGPGTYRFRMRVSDGMLDDEGEVEYTFNVAPLPLRVDAGPDTLVILPDGGQVSHRLSGSCTGGAPGAYSSTEWQLAVEPAGSNLQSIPAFPAVNVWDPNLTFTTEGDYVFKLIAKNQAGAEVGWDEVYIKVKPASQQFTTYLYLYDMTEPQKTQWCYDTGQAYCPPANLVFSSYEDGTKLAFQRIDPNGVALQMYDVGAIADPNFDPNIVNITEAVQMTKGQYVYVNGQDSVYKVTSGNNRFSVLAGDVIRDPVSGYFVMSKNGLGVDTEFYSHISRQEYGGRRMVLFAYEDNTHITIRWDSDKDGVCGETHDEYLVMQRFDLPTESSEDIIMNQVLMQKGEHLYRLPSTENIYIHVEADKPVSIEVCNDSGFYVPSSDGLWTGKNFNIHLDSSVHEGIEIYTTISPSSVFAYQDDTRISIKKKVSENRDILFWSGVLHAGELFISPEEDISGRLKRTALDLELLFNETERRGYYTLESTKPVSVTVRPTLESSFYAHGDFVPDRKGSVQITV